MHHSTPRKVPAINKFQGKSNLQNKLFSKNNLDKNQLNRDSNSFDQSPATNNSCSSNKTSENRQLYSKPIDYADKHKYNTGNLEYNEDISSIQSLEEVSSVSQNKDTTL